MLLAFNSTLESVVLLTIVLVNLVTLIALVFFERRNPEKVIKWMGVLLFLPLLGFFFYMWFGKGPSFGNKKKVLNKVDKDKEYLAALELQSKIVDEVLKDNNLKISEMIKFNISQSKSICTPNNDVRMFVDMNEYYNVMFDEIKNAKQYVNLEFFIIKPDKYGKALVELLTEKAKSGIEIRLIYDNVGSLLLSPFFFSKLKKAGGKVEKFLPVFFPFSMRNVNYRNHRKIVVIDGVIAYTGGCNIGKEYCGQTKRTSPWRDTQIRIIGPSVNMLNIRFLQDYNFASGEKILQDFRTYNEKQGNLPMQIVSCGPDSYEVGIESAYIKAIYSAERSVYIETPYLILDEPFKMAIITAVKSGVDVKIIIPGKPDKRFVYYSTLSFAQELVENNVKIYLYNGFIHSKVLVIDDDITSIGTFNIDIRSFKLHFEVTAFIYGNTFGQKMIEQFGKDLVCSKNMDKSYILSKSLWQRFCERIAILFSPLF